MCSRETNGCVDEERGLEIGVSQAGGLEGPRGTTVCRMGRHPKWLLKWLFLVLRLCTFTSKHKHFIVPKLSQPLPPSLSPALFLSLYLILSLSHAHSLAPTPALRPSDLRLISSINDSGWMSRYKEE